MVEITWTPDGLRPELARDTECAICHKKLKVAQCIILQHRAERIQIYNLCSSYECYEKMGKHMAKGKH